MSDSTWSEVELGRKFLARRELRMVNAFASFVFWFMAPLALLLLAFVVGERIMSFGADAFSSRWFLVCAVMVPLVAAAEYMLLLQRAWLRKEIAVLDAEIDAMRAAGRSDRDIAEEFRNSGIPMAEKDVARWLSTKSAV